MRITTGGAAAPSATTAAASSSATAMAGPAAEPFAADPLPACRAAAGKVETPRDRAGPACAHAPEDGRCG